MSSTKERILAGARAVFNAEGFSAPSALDVATALGISPGHLYYHFKGKPDLGAALFRAHAEEIAAILEGLEAARTAPTLQTLWTFVHILVEEAYECRFFYLAPGELCRAHPEIMSLYRRQQQSLVAAFQRWLLSLNAAGALAISAEGVDGVADAMAQAIGMRAPHLGLMGDPGPDKALIARAAAAIMMLPAAHAPAPVSGGRRTRKRAV